MARRRIQFLKNQKQLLIVCEDSMKDERWELFEWTAIVIAEKHKRPAAHLIGEKGREKFRATELA